MLSERAGVLHAALAAQDPQSHEGGHEDLCVCGQRRHADTVSGSCWVLARCEMLPSSMCRFMRQMTTEKLFDDGKYMVIYLYPESVKFDERMFFLWTKQDHEQVT